MMINEVSTKRRSSQSASGMRVYHDRDKMLPNSELSTAGTSMNLFADALIQNSESWCAFLWRLWRSLSEDTNPKNAATCASNRTAGIERAVLFVLPMLPTVKLTSRIIGLGLTHPLQGTIQD